jgi:hypothetical protein
MIAYPLRAAIQAYLTEIQQPLDKNHRHRPERRRPLRRLVISRTSVDLAFNSKQLVYEAKALLNPASLISRISNTSASSPLPPPRSASSLYGFWK